MNNSFDVHAACTMLVHEILSILKSVLCHTDHRYYIQVPSTQVQPLYIPQRAATKTILELLVIKIIKWFLHYSTPYMVLNNQGVHKLACTQKFINKLIT